MFPDSIVFDETFGKRQRAEAKVKRRAAKEERRIARRVQRQVLSTSSATEDRGYTSHRERSERLINKVG